MRQAISRVLLIGMLTFGGLQALSAQSAQVPDVSLHIGSGNGNGDLSTSLQIIFLLTILSLAPAIIMLLTSFSRIVIVLGFTRTALGTQQIPPNSVLIGLALFLTLFTMEPTFKAVNDTALQPFLAHQITFDTAQERALLPMRSFMFRQTREQDLLLFTELSNVQQRRVQADIPTFVLIPAFITSELKTAFMMGFLIFIPFVVIDLVVATVLMSMGMMMMPPVLISLPCKLMLFVLIDGWSLLAKSLVVSFS